MRKRIWRFFRMRFIRAYVKIGRKLNKPTQFSEFQVKAARIVRKMINSSESEIVISPSTGNYHIRWGDIFCIFMGDVVQIINGKYFYQVALHRHQSLEIYRLYRRIQEKKIKALEQEISSRTQRSFDSIIEELETKSITQKPKTWQD